VFWAWGRLRRRWVEKDGGEDATREAKGGDLTGACEGVVKERESRSCELK
jgi:hypothetical protein